LTGYLHPAYSAALENIGTPRQLPGSSAWVLLRPIPRSRDKDAIGCYPLFTCRDWSRLRADVDALAGDAVSLFLVMDPLGTYDISDLRLTFPDLCRPYKEHFIIDLSGHSPAALSTNHRRNLRRAQRLVQVEHAADPLVHAQEWFALYDHLVARHSVTGPAAFSRASLARQLGVPGVSMFRAIHQGVTVGINLWYAQKDAAYFHLGACNETGYATSAPFALIQGAIDYFRGHVQRLSLGAGAGTWGDASDGLSRFKRGWASSTRTAWRCGRILNRARYVALATEHGTPDSDYFPTYRAGESA